MSEIEMYINQQFKKLPRKKYYRELKNEILASSEDKFHDYCEQMSEEEAQQKVIEEIGQASDFYRGDKLVAYNVQLILLGISIAISLFVLIMLPTVRELYQRLMLDEYVFGIKVGIYVFWYNAMIGVVIGYCIGLLAYFILIKKAIKLNAWLKGLLVISWIMEIAILLIFSVSWTFEGGFLYSFVLYIYNLNKQLIYIISQYFYSMSYLNVIVVAILAFGTNIWLNKKID